MKRISQFLRLYDDSLSVENRTFIIATVSIFLANSIGLLISISLGLSSVLNVILSFTLLMYLGFVYLSIKGKVNDRFRFYFLIISLILIIPLWYLNGGSDGSTPIYLAFFICVGLLSLPGKWHIPCTVFFLCLYLLLLFSENIFPYLLFKYPSPAARYYDIASAGILICILLIVLMIFFKTTYEADLKKLAQGKKIIEDARAELEVANEKAVAATEAKSRFLANMSHEIRTPLNGIMGSAELLKTSLLTPEQKEYLRVIESSSYILTSIIKDILDISKIEAGQVELTRKPFYLYECVQNIISISLPQIKSFNKEIQLSFNKDNNSDIYVLADEGRLSQILLNLVGNAIKFTENGNIIISVQKESPSNNTSSFTFTITDTGIGISPENLQKLFIPFSQIYNTSDRKYGGTGLGLSISRKLVEMMDGKIWAESKEGKGSVFSFSIPLEIVEAPAKAEPVESKTAMETTLSNPVKPSILLAEDNKMNQFVISKMFAHLGHTIEVAENGVEAVAKATAKPYDLIFMDIQMPEMDGFEATTNILSYFRSAQTKPPVIIAMTANAMKEDKIECLKAGMNDFATKPVSFEQLKMFIEKWIPGN